ncbi:hypothetical protein ACIO8F_34610 [Streptomyces sp. NPDC087228]|uniref:hypothetical protein n=1 Tax=Streptomyces sp. NPDC087228 TaxID=3365772 RepID=UPI0037FE2971
MACAPALRTPPWPSPRAIALGAAAQLAAEERADGQAERIAQLRDLLNRRPEAALPGRVQLNGPAKKRLPNTLNISIDTSASMASWDTNSSSPPPTASTSPSAAIVPSAASPTA